MNSSHGFNVHIIEPCLGVNDYLSVLPSIEGGSARAMDDSVSTFCREICPSFRSLPHHQPTKPISALFEGGVDVVKRKVKCVMPV